MKYKTALSLLILAIILAGCGAAGPKFDRESQPFVDSNHALLYIYRPNINALGARTASIQLNEKKIGGLRKGGYLVVKLEPGNYVLTQTWDDWLGVSGGLDKPISVGISLIPGSAAYWRLTTGAAPGPWEYNKINIDLNWSLRKISPATALSELSQLNRENLEPPFVGR